jgi:NhaP-type Na+/H+ or K+/H+ antiporter
LQLRLTLAGIRGIITLACAIIFATLFANQGQKTDTFNGEVGRQGSQRRVQIVYVLYTFCTLQPS